MFNKIRNCRIHLVLMLVLLGSVPIVTPVFAAGITINTVTDEDGTGANCSLREAITTANTDAPIMLIPGCQWTIGEHWGILGLMKDEIAIRSQSRATPQSSARADCSYQRECPSAALSSLVRHGG